MIVAVLTVFTSVVCSVCSSGDRCAASNGTLAALDPLATSQRELRKRDDVPNYKRLSARCLGCRRTQHFGVDLRCWVDLGILWCRETFPRVDMTKQHYALPRPQVQPRTTVSLTEVLTSREGPDSRLSNSRVVASHAGSWSVVMTCFNDRALPST